MKRLFKKALPLLLAALAVLWLWWGNNTLSVEEYVFSSQRLPQGWDFSFSIRVGRLASSSLLTSVLLLSIPMLIHPLSYHSLNLL